MSQSGERGEREGRRERKKRELRRRIYDRAAQLFLVQGYSETTVEQIAEAADVAQATFFNHFASKDALLAEMTPEVYRVIRILMEQESKQPGTTQQRLARMAEDAALLIEQTRNLTREMLLELTRSSARKGQAETLLSQAHDLFEAFLREGQARGDVRTDQDARFLSEMLVGVFYASLTNWLNADDYPLRERLRRAAVFIGEAFAPGRGAPPDGAP